MKITTNISLKKRNGTCPRTGKGTTKGQVGDTNNNDNNIIYFNLFNKYKEQILDTNYYGQKIKLISDLKQEQEYELLSEEEQNRLFNELIALK